MKFLECGNASVPTILMIHGMGMTAVSSFGYAVERLKDETADVFTKYGMKMVCLGDYGHGEVMLLHSEQ